MLKVLIVVAASLFSNFALSQSHISINGARSSYNRNVFFDQSILGFSGRMSKKGDASIFGSANQTWTGYGIRDGLGIELYKFIHVSLVHTHVNQESKAGGNDYFSGSELQANLALSFDSPIGTLNFGLGGQGGHVTMQSAEKSSRFAGTGRAHFVTWNYFVNPILSITVRAEQSEGNYRQNSGDTGISEFTLNRDVFGLGFKLWL